ncbi:MAG: (Fe-S)-binding protein [Dehalococcoidia bacterium]|nr:(Fe-S)-binding protein [Dehalococcoidia bacterium]
METERKLEQVTDCALCPNMCKYSCPVFLATGNETLSPQKIARLILYEEKALIADRQGFFEVVFGNAMCGACKRHCLYKDYDLREFILAGRVKAFNEGWLPEETRKRIDNFRKYGNPNGERALIEKGTGSTGYFISCSSYKDESILKAVDRLVAASGEQVQQFGGSDICCGGPLYYAGDLEGFRAAAQEMAARIRDRKLERLIVDCPNCMKMLTGEYPKADVHLDVEIVHTTRFLSALLGEGKIRVSTTDTSATYHDPCILANDFDITEPPREILQRLGYRIVEPVYSRTDTHCCGGPAGARIGEARLARKVSEMRVNELRQTGAEVYTSACATCKAVLALPGMKDITELVAERLVDG